MAPADLLCNFTGEIVVMKELAPGIYPDLKAKITGYAPDLANPI